MDAVALVERHGVTEKRDGAVGGLVGEHLGVGQASGVIDRDVNVVPARDPSLVAVSVVDTLRRVALNAGDALAGASMDASQLLDVDVDQLARPRSFIAKRGLEAQPAALAPSQPLADRAARRERPTRQ